MADVAQRVYYNEFDPTVAQWLRHLIAAGHLPAGDVDERSIEDVRPDELAGYTQCHFFAGIGGWPYALALAGWPMDRPVWTGSCPCQPFSAAGKGAGFEDERHLWPSWQHLIRECRPPVIFGEQVASSAVGPWIDLVHADMEGMGYAFGCVPFPAAGIGAPHIRDRTYWVGVGLADTDHAGLEGWLHSTERADQFAARAHGMADRLAHSGSSGSSEQRRQWYKSARPSAPSVSNRMANASSSGRREEYAYAGRGGIGDSAQGLAAGSVHGSSDLRPGPTNGQWEDADWIFCTDGKWRPVEPGSFPLAHGLSARVVRLCAYGNAIVPQQAAEFVAAHMELCDIEAPERAA